MIEDLQRGGAWTRALLGRWGCNVDDVMMM